jgi:TolB-like protein
MVTASAAWPHESLEELYYRKLHTAPELPSARAPSLPKHWERAILWCLQRDPAQRPQTAEEVMAVLNETAEGPTLALPAPSPQKRFTRRWLFAAGGATSLLFIAGAGVVGSDPHRVDATLAVFPFANQTRQSDYDYLCTGTSDELMRRLMYVGGLSVYPVRDSSAAAEARRKARFSLEGNLQHHNGRVRLSASIIENASGTLIWSDGFEGDTIDPLRLEAEIATNVVRSIQERVLRGSGISSRMQLAFRQFGEPARSLLGRPTPDPFPAQATQNGTAFSEYAKGRQLWRERTLQKTLEAVEHFKRAIAEDQKFALAYAALADVQHTLMTYNQESTAQLLATAKAYAEKAVQLDPSLPEVHLSLAAARQSLWDWEGATDEFLKALKAQPTLARAHHWYGGMLLQFGRFDEGLAQLRQGIENDPFEYSSQSAYALSLWNAGQAREAATQLETLLAHKDLQYAHTVLGQVYAWLACTSSEPEATDYFVRSLREGGLVRIREMEAAGGVDPGWLKWSDLIFAQAHSARKDRRSAQVYIDRLESGLRAGRISASAVAWATAAAGQHARTFELLEIGFAQREREMLNLKIVPLFRPLRSHPRFQSLLRQMRLPV